MNPFFEKKPREVFSSMFYPTMGFKCPKTFSHLAARSAVKPCSFYKKIDPKSHLNIFLPKKTSPKNFRSEFQFLGKVMLPLGGQKVAKYLTCSIWHVQRLWHVQANGAVLSFACTHWNKSAYLSILDIRRIACLL